MEITFYIAAALAVFSTVMVITRFNAIHALLYLIVSLLAVAVVFFIIGAPFIAALEVIVYAGAIMVLFIFVVMMLNLGRESQAAEKKILNSRMWIGPGLVALILLIDLVYILTRAASPGFPGGQIAPREVGLALFGPYVLAVELAAFLLMSGIIGAYHLGRREKQVVHRFLREDGN